MGPAISGRGCGACGSVQGAAELEQLSWSEVACPPDFAGHTYCSHPGRTQAGWLCEPSLLLSDLI